MVAKQKRKSLSVRLVDAVYLAQECADKCFSDWEASEESANTHLRSNDKAKEAIDQHQDTLRTTEERAVFFAVYVSELDRLLDRM